MMDATGAVTDVSAGAGTMAQRTEFFLAAPVAWLEESIQFQGHITYVELPELNVYMKGQAGNAVVEFTKDQLTRILTSLTQSFCALIDQVAKK